jgi:hypothetical protein
MPHYTKRFSGKRADYSRGGILTKDADRVGIFAELTR